MKWVRYLFAGLGGLLGLALLVLLAIGGGRGEGRLVHSVEIMRPANVVFAWVSQPERVKAWLGWLIEVKPLTPPPAASGSRYVFVMEDRNNNNQRMDIETEYTRFEADRLLETRLRVPGGFTGVVTYELQPMDANRTHLTYRGVYHFEHWLAKLLEPVISRAAQQKLQEDLQRLKQKAEAE